MGADLLLGITRASSGEYITRVVTNARLATDDLAAKNLILALVDAGLKEINFSTGDQHTKFVSLENVLRGCRAAVRAHLTVCLMVEIVEDRTISATTIREHEIFRALCDECPDAKLLITESSGCRVLHPQSALSIHPDLLSIELIFEGRKGCESCLSTTSVQADGRIAACCGLGMPSNPGDADRTHQ